jgi:hypothetical protein
VVTALGEAYKQIDAVDGKFALATLAASTKGIASGSAANDSEYTATEAALTKLGSQRDALASKIDALLLGAEFGGRPVSPIAALGLLGQAKFLLIQANRLAATTQ